MFWVTLSEAVAQYRFDVYRLLPIDEVMKWECEGLLGNSVEYL